MDFVIRETRAVIEGPMICVRLGTCGTPQKSIEVGSFVVSDKGSIFISRNYDSFLDPSVVDEQPGNGGNSLRYYNITRPVPADEELSKLVTRNAMVICLVTFPFLARQKIARNNNSFSPLWIECDSRYFLL